MRVIFVNIGMFMFRGGGENFDLSLSSELLGLGHDTELYSLEPLSLVPLYALLKNLM